MIVVLGQYPGGRLGLVPDDLRQRVASYVEAARKMGLPDEDIEEDIYAAFPNWDGCCADDIVVNGNIALLSLFA